MRRKFLSHILVIVLYTALTLALTWPMALHFTTHVVGSETWAFDEYTFMWNMWWFRHSLLHLGTSPLYSNYIFYPLGISLVPYTFQFFNAALFLPLQPIFNLAVLSNLALLFGFVMSGYGAYLLILYFLAPKLPHSPTSNLQPPTSNLHLSAFVGGAIYTFTASHFIYAALGHHNIVSTEWIPFYALYLIKTAREPGWKNPRLAALFAALSLYCDMIFGSFLALFTIFYLLFLRHPAGGIWALGKRLVVLVASSLLFYAPLLPPVLREMVGGEYVMAGWGEGVKLSADLAGFFTPTALHPWWGGNWARELQAVVEGTSRFADVNTVFIGWALFLFALAVAIFCWKKVAFWAASAFIFAVFSLGPVLHINGRYIFDLEGLKITFPLPFIILHYLPFFKASRSPNRFSVVLMLSLAVLAGYGTFQLLKAMRGKRLAACLALLALLLVEHLSFPLPLTDARVPEIYREIRSERGDFALMQLPLGWRNSFGTLGAESTQAQYYQSVYGKPFIGGNISRNPPFKFEYFQQIPLFKSITDLELYKEVDEATFQKAKAQAPELMYLYDVRYLVILPPIPGRLPYSDTFTRTVEYARHALPLEEKPFYDRDGVQAYRVVQPEPKMEFTIDFGADGSGIYRGEGWSGDEAEVFGATACWAVEQGARFFFPLRQVTDYVMELRATPFAYEGAPTQVLRLWVNGREISPPLSLHPGWDSYKIPLSTSLLKYGLNEARLNFAYLASPYDVLPADMRIGGTGVEAPAEVEVHSGPDFAYITVGGDDASAHRRGYNVAVIAPDSGKVIEKRGFDTWANEYEAQALAAFLEEIEPGQIVVVAAQGEADRHLTDEAVAALRSLGMAGDPRENPGRAHALIGVKGASPATALEKREEGSAYLRVGRVPDRRTLAVAVDCIRFTAMGHR